MFLEVLVQHINIPSIWVASRQVLRGLILVEFNLAIVFLDRQIAKLKPRQIFPLCEWSNYNNYSNPIPLDLVHLLPTTAPILSHLMMLRQSQIFSATAGFSMYCSANLAHACQSTPTATPHLQYYWQDHVPNC